MKILLTLLALSSFASADEMLSVDPSQSSITYGLVHKFHKFDGVSKKVEGKARLADGKAQVMVRAPVESFDSGNVNRDAHMKETVDAARYPSVDLKAVADIAPPAKFPTTESKTFRAQLTFHGVTQSLDVPAQLTWEAADRVRVQANFSVSLEAYKIERPSLMFVKIDDAMKVDAKLLFKR